jgi:hypothetical protein
VELGQGCQMDYYKSRTFSQKKTGLSTKKQDILKIGF